MTSAQQSAKEKAFEILTEHFESCLIVVSSEIEGRDNRPELNYCYDGGQCQALGLAKYAEHKIINDFPGRMTSLTLELPGLGEVVVEYEAFPATRGARGSCGEALEPDCPASVEVASVKCNNAEVMGILSPWALEQVERECLRREGV
jgi:hypothetical protein